MGYNKKRWQHENPEQREARIARIKRQIEAGNYDSTGLKLIETVKIIKANLDSI